MPADEQDDVFERLHQLRVRRVAGDESMMARCVRSLRRVAGVVGRVPSVDDYKRVSKDLLAAGEDIEPFTRLYKHSGSWPRATEALTLAESMTFLVAAHVRGHRWEERSACTALAALALTLPLLGESVWLWSCSFLLFVPYWWLRHVEHWKRQGSR